MIAKEIKDQVTVLSLDNPGSYNSLSLDMLSALKKELQSVKNKTVIIRGNGKGFCAGHDLKEIRSQANQDFYKKLMELCSEVMQTIRKMPQPVIAQVHGVATAAGCQLVSACDLAFASQSSRFATPGVLIGLFCSTPAVPLSRNIHLKHAMEMLLTGDMIDSQTAFRFGLVNRVFPDSELERGTFEWTEKIASKSLETLAMGKESFYRQVEMPISEAYELASQAMVNNLQTADCHEGIDAFLEKRSPKWTK